MIWGKLQFFNSLIFILYTFFENHKYLSAYADCLKQLMKISCHNTVFTALQSHFLYKNQMNDQYIVKVVKNTFIIRSEWTADHFDLLYWQLWLCVMQHYQKMSRDVKKKKKDLLTKAKVERADKKVLFDFVTFADCIGFELSQIYDLMQQLLNSEIVHNTLLKA